MTIQFQCPHCESILRVPDPFMGKSAPCPRCQKLLVVPLPVIPENKGTTPHTAPGTSTAQTVKAASADPPAEGVEQLFAVLTEEHLHRLDEDPLIRSATRPRQTAATILTTIIFVGLTIAGLFGLQRYLYPPMRGTLPGEIVATQTIPQFMISLKPRLSDREVKMLQGYFGGDQLNINSTMIRSRIAFDGDKLVVNIEPGKASNLVRVDVLQNKPLQEFHKRGYAPLNEERRQVVEQNLSRFVGRIDKDDSKDQADLLTGFLYDVAAFESVQGLGYALVAIVEGESYPCLWQDSQDRIYFCVPYQAKSFEVVERPFEPGPSRFPQNPRFVIEVGAKSATPAPPEPEPAGTSTAVEEVSSSEG
ncbi:MAG: hypothetical protein KDA78_00135 [Planctomycetaceae bacterium]|nr:hypothetical protein [Planctomycetaceae bacterium]